MRCCCLHLTDEHRIYAGVRCQCGWLSARRGLLQRPLLQHWPRSAKVILLMVWSKLSFKYVQKNKKIKINSERCEDINECDANNIYFNGLEYCGNHTTCRCQSFVKCDIIFDSVGYFRIWSIWEFWFNLIICSNTVGSLSCSCTSGYVEWSAINGCRDKNECTEVPTYFQYCQWNIFNAANNLFSMLPITYFQCCQ